MKELIKMTLVAIGTAGSFLGVQLLSNYIHYGTFIFS